ncbi:Adenylate cyclase [Beggiatoa sp. PS]|nr:Adenylate cyclase [Beggiatoa sp. PS]
MATETELKLYIAPEDAEKFMQHPLLQQANSRQAPLKLYNTYFDTPEHTLLQHGVGLRVRQIGKKRIQTLKTADEGLGGLHQRQEWENEISGDKPNYNQFPKKALPKWCADKKNLQKIKPLFTTDFSRTIWDLILDDGTQIEVALDKGEIKTETHSCPLSEVELELKSGSPDKLYQVALTLQNDLPLIIENKSKAARGYALHQFNPPEFHKAGTVKLTANMTTEQAFFHIVWHCLGHLQANEDVVLYGENIEGVHQMRVALRRLRSCLTLYQSLIPKETTKQFRQEVKWITDVLGVARDWDVFALTLQDIQSQDNYSQLIDLQAQVADFQKNAYVEVRNALRSPRYSRLLLLLGRWLTQRRWRKKLNAVALKKLEIPIKNFANQVLDSHYQSVKTQGENFVSLNPEQLHQLRISIKKLGYGVRFLSNFIQNHSFALIQKNCHICKMNWVF